MRIICNRAQNGKEENLKPNREGDAVGQERIGRDRNSKEASHSLWACFCRFGCERSNIGAKKNRSNSSTERRVSPVIHCPAEDFAPVVLRCLRCRHPASRVFKFVYSIKQNPVCLFWVAKIGECDRIRPFPDRAGDEIKAKNPLRINELWYIITVCYPAKCAGWICVFTASASPPKF